MSTANSTVKVIKDSISNTGHRLTTLELRYWRSIHPEVVRHRCFSHCVESSRARPVKHNINEVLYNPFIPSHWTLNQSGMVGEEITDPELVESLRKDWIEIARRTAKTAQRFSEKDNLHKQVVNRLLEPYLYTKQIIAGTDWDNFIKLRTASDAEPHIRDLAFQIQDALAQSEPEFIPYSSWHLPYVTEDDHEPIEKYIRDLGYKMEIETVINIKKRISAARCARCSYKAYDGTTSITKDLDLAMRLIQMKHYSPFEFVATPVLPSIENKPYCGNYDGWLQFRKQLE